MNKEQIKFRLLSYTRIIRQEQGEDRMVFLGYGTQELKEEKERSVWLGREARQSKGGKRLLSLKRKLTKETLS